MTCQKEHRWDQVWQDGVYYYRCALCFVLGREVQSNPLIVKTIKCVKGCGEDATHKILPPSNSYLCEKDFLDRLAKFNPSYRRGH
jgi:hypothetical protein